jgi:hypothetical protein
MSKSFKSITNISVFSICLAAYIARVLLVEFLLLLAPNAIILLLEENHEYLHKYDQSFHANNYEVLIDNHLLTKK